MLFRSGVGYVTINSSVPAASKGISVDWNSSSDAGEIQSIHQGTAYKSLLLQPAGGNVGIGTSSPGYKLDVSGTLNATTILQGGASVAPLASPTFTGTVTVPTPSNSTDAATKQYVDSVTLNTQTASYTLALTDAGKVVEMNVASANNLTVPPNSSIALPVGTTIDIVQYGAGQTTIVAGSGVTIRSSGSKLKLTGQYSAATLYKRGTDEWVAMGDLTS